MYCKPKYRANLFKYILLVLAILFFVTSAVRISLPSVFCILDILLIQVYKRSGTNHRFVAVVLQIFIDFVMWPVPGSQLVVTNENSGERKSKRFKMRKRERGGLGRKESLLAFLNVLLPPTFWVIRFFVSKCQSIN